MAILLAGSAGFSAVILITNDQTFNSPGMRRRWTRSSLFQKDLMSIDFWACLALPLSCVIWSVNIRRGQTHSNVFEIGPPFYLY